MSAEASGAFRALLDERRVIVCVGSGGVGKTTTSAVIALQAALSGQRALVLTIDPAKRLANSLGVDELDNEPRALDLSLFERLGHAARGTLHAMMLDMKASFDEVVRRHSPSEAAARRIMDNKLYHYFSTSLAGTQEYAAAERLYAIDERGDFDLIVLDTPPTSHALDFLEAPTRLADAVSSRAMQFLYRPAKSSLLGVGTGYVVKTLSKFTGSEMLTELGGFLNAFSSLFQGLQERANKVSALLTGPDSTFVVITSPRPSNVDEALYFYDQLGKSSSRVGAIVANRVHPRWVDPALETSTPNQVAALLGESAPGGIGFARKLQENAAELGALAELDARSIRRIRGGVPDRVPIMRVPFFRHDIHSLEGLDHVRRALFEIEARGGVARVARAIDTGA